VPSYTLSAAVMPVTLVMLARLMLAVVVAVILANV
jgi:hypothetical protein